ncbi:hypothetical protein SAMN04490206_6272 [Pseudomonas umsongensis]|nr:hypothetical protein SAMN04490206_6272 [Pseudomonas umsongensis]
MLAIEANDNAGNLTPRDALRFIASRLAPTGDAHEKAPAFIECRGFLLG